MPEPGSHQKPHHRKQTDGWVTARRITQIAALLIFLAAVVVSRPGGLSPNLAGLAVRISPLAMLANLLSSKTFLAGSTLSLIVLLSGLVVGRAWCGWLCPLGTLLDLFHFSRPKGQKEPPRNLRKVKYGLLMVILLSAIFGNLTLLIFDPLTIFFRSTTLTILPVLDRSIYAVEKLLIGVPFLSNAVSSFDAWLRPLIFPVAAPSIQYALLFGFFFIAIILLNLIAERFWCRYLCPLGAMLGLPSKLALFQRRLNAGCTECGLCSARCPTGTIDPGDHFLSDPSECTLCMNCRSACAKDATTFTPKWQPARRQSYDVDRRLFLASLGVSIVSVALFSVDWIKRRAKNFFLRPPGITNDQEFLAKCVRCGECLKVCPTQALQADAGLSGLEGAFTPVLLPRNGFCDFACNACGEYCPTGAIPLLPLEVKQQTVLGHAYIDQNRCLAWSDHTNCIVCEEMCPLPQKAITLEPKTFTAADGSEVEVKLPVVDRTRCIGCGTCENKCPLKGDAAIRVYTIQSG